MIKIEIRIDVKNADQIVRKHKGRVASVFAVLFMNKAKLKAKVEGVMAEEIIKALQDNIGKNLEVQGVRADWDIVDCTEQ